MFMVDMMGMFLDCVGGIDIVSSFLINILISFYDCMSGLVIIGCGFLGSCDRRG